jgi:putative Mn2+ efflux pump MntP
MQTFSPNYNSITVAVLESRSDSMREWKETNTVSIHRSLNANGLLPVVGVVVGTYRIFTGLLDVISSLFKQVIGASSFNQGSIGITNIMRGLLEISPTVMFFGAFTPITPIIGVVCGLAMIMIMPAYDIPNTKGLKTSYVTIFYDGIPTIQFEPKRSWNSYTAEDWLDEAKKYGHWIRKDFIPV